MAKGSVRKKGKKWYYRFYVEDASGKMVQKEYAGTESKSETEKLLRKALEDYEDKKFVAKADNLTVSELLDMWSEEELKTGTLSNGTVENYLGAIRCIKKHPIADRKLKTVTAEHLQAFLDLLTFGGEFPDGNVRKGYSKDYIHSFSAVLQQSFRFAVFPKQLISFNPMQYIKLKRQAEEVDLFSDDEVEEGTQPISHEDYERLIKYLEKKNPPAILPIQIAYYAGLRIGETCGLTWQDINLEDQCLIIKRSIRYDGTKHKNVIGTTKRKKVTVYLKALIYPPIYAAPCVPIIPLVKKYNGTPTIAAPEKQISCRFVRFNATLILIPLKSFGTGTDIAIVYSFLIYAPFLRKVPQNIIFQIFYFSEHEKLILIMNLS